MSHNQINKSIKSLIIDLQVLMGTQLRLFLKLRLSVIGESILGFQKTRKEKALLLNHLARLGESPRICIQILSI